nr:DUF6543 domain-containing protein [uncultured Pseudomonas sp.]
MPRLSELDLRDNQIETLPEDVFKGHAVPNKGTNLYGNPLSADTLKKVVVHQQKTGVSLGIIASDWLQRHEQRLTQEGLALAMRAAGLSADQSWQTLTLEQLQAPTRVPSTVKFGLLKLYRYTATDIWAFRDTASARVLVYVPANSSPLHEFANTAQLRQWVATQGKLDATKQALARHFAEDDREDGTFHAGVLTALDGMAIYPAKHWLGNNAGFFNNDGYWDPNDYIGFDDPAAATDPFARLLMTMKQAARAELQAIRDDAQVNRDQLSAVVEPVVQWVNRFGPLALFVPGGEGVLALAGLIDAGYGLNQAVNGKTPGQRSEGRTRTVFGLLNALPMLGAESALNGSAAQADSMAERVREPTLNARLNDVIELSMHGFHLTEHESLNGFLEGFPNLEVLNLEGFDLRPFFVGGDAGRALPPVIGQLPKLVSLNLRATQLAFTERAASQLSDLTHLQTLDLSDNPLGVPPVVLGMNNLRQLNLRNTAINRCPVGVKDEPYLTMLDLRDNRITRVPPAIINQAVADDRVLLWGNPLTDEDTLHRLISHREQTGINLWLSAPGADYGTPTVWLRDCDEALQQSRQALWQRLAGKPSGTRFLAVIDRLSLTADFRVSYLSLQARVWRLLQEADASEDMWGRIIRGSGRFDHPMAAFRALEARAGF